MVLGIDPGVKGGLAVLNSAGQVLYAYSLVDKKVKEAVAAMKIAAALTRPFGLCYIEKVGYMRGDGGKGAFTFGEVYGILYGAALCFELEVHDVYPMTWQGRMECLTQGAKNVSKNRAIALWPTLPDGLKMNHYIADALLIAEYGRRQELGIR